jgi:sugar (pentulose or hexulose) kinase
VTGWPPHGWLAAAKLRQMVERKQVPEGACHMATVPDLIYAQFLGELRTDVTGAQITGLADFQGRRRSPAILDWIEMDESWLPSIVPGLGVLAEDIESPWGNLTLVTGSHDQYAAMEAAGLDKLLRHSGLTQAFLTELETAFAGMSAPEGPVRVNLDAGEVEPSGDAATSVRRYMAWAGSMVSHALEVCGLKHPLERIVATGGAMASRFWPQTIASICGLTLEAVDCASFTAYGAALHARTALLGPGRSHRFPDTATVRTYTPQRPHEYREWYCRHQKPLLDWQGD